MFQFERISLISSELLPFVSGITVIMKIAARKQFVAKNHMVPNTPRVSSIEGYNFSKTNPKNQSSNIATD